VVVERRQELPGQVAVGDVKLDAVETGGDGAPRRVLVALQMYSISCSSSSFGVGPPGISPAGNWLGASM
jgi:hypothetical protein